MVCCLTLFLGRSLEFQGSKVQRFKGSKVQGSGFRVQRLSVQRFMGSRFRGLRFRSRRSASQFIPATDRRGNQSNRKRNIRVHRGDRRERREKN